MFESYENLPIRVGFLVDASASMLGYTDSDHAIVQLYASHLFRKGVDRGFVMQFDMEPAITQKWTNSANSIVAGAAAVRRRGDHLPITRFSTPCISPVVTNGQKMVAR
jgi:hypothetical protein